MHSSLLKYMPCHLSYLVYIYITTPPRANLQIIKGAMVFAASYPEAYVLCIEDFNLLLDHAMDRHGDPLVAPSPGLTAFNALIMEFGWRDLWRNLEFSITWSIPSRCTLSRIDLAISDDRLIPKISDVKNLPRGVSNQSP